MKGPWRLVLPYAQSNARGLGVLGGLAAAGVAVETLKPWPMKLLVDHVLTRKPLPGMAAWVADIPGGGSPSGLAAWLAGGTLLLFLVAQGLSLAQAWLRAGLGARLTCRLGGDLFEHLQRLSPVFHTRHRAGDLIRRVLTDAGCARELLFSVVFPGVTSVLSLAVMFAVMWSLNRSLSVAALALALPLLLLIRRFSRPIEERAYRQYELEGEMSALAEQTLAALPVIQAYTREEHHDHRFRSLSREGLGAYLRTTAAGLQFKVGTSGVTAVGTAVLMALGGLQVLQGSLTLGSLLVFLSYLGSLYAPLESLAYIGQSHAVASAGARRVLEVLEAGEEVREAADARALPPATTRGAHLRLEGVSFGYDPHRPVLHRLSLEVQPGETVALVGRTGAGKSTLVSLIPRFFDPQEGRVLFDGIDVRELQLASLRSRVALVLQEPFLLPLSVAENLAYGKPGATREEIEAAAVAANADGFIRRLPQGYDTVLGERGATLSGGEKQRLSIARALLKDAPVLILDEPTSALDVETEASVLEALERLMEGRTTFLIAHRLSTVQRADRVVMLDEGQAIDQGPPDGFLHRRGLSAGLLTPALADA